MATRRKFIEKAVKGGATITLGAIPTMKYANVLGSNQRLNVAVMGLNSRGNALIEAIHAYPNAKIKYNCDVDEKILNEQSEWCKESIGYTPKMEKDFRKVLEDKDVDAVFIATPDHWHAPMSILALESGKHVYVEKPCSHNPREAELLVAAQKKYGKKVQMGNQSRSNPRHRFAIEEICNGIIGDVYLGEAYYSNNRPSIGKGEVIEVPDTLNWDLWQGPAPREEYKSNFHPYNWHWFRKWGTGEVNNNGTHEIDICRWALGVDFPKTVTSFGGKYTYDDDWEFPDMQKVTYQFDDSKLITWTGHSRGENVTDQPNANAVIYGSKGAIIFSKVDYSVYDLEGNLVEKEKETVQTDSRDIRGLDSKTIYHIANFFDAINKDEKLNSPIVDASISTIICHLGNIAQDVGRTIKTDPSSGKIVGDTEAMSFWEREYAPHWEPKQAGWESKL